MLASLRPDSWNLPLFLHVLGAVALFGGALAVGVVAVAARRRPEHAAMLTRLGFRTLLIVVLPAFVLMRVTGQWIVDKEYPHGHEPGWVDVGFNISDPGLVLILILCVLAWWSARRAGLGRAGMGLAVLAPLYLAALAVAWWAMSAKPGS
jgi:uncharacterized membrane protein